MFIVKMNDVLQTQFYDRKRSVYCLCSKVKYVYVGGKVLNSSIIWIKIFR